MGFAKVFRFIGILLGAPMAFFGFLLRFPEHTGGLAENLHITADPHFGLMLLITGGLMFVVGVICVFVCISDAGFNKAMRQTTIFAEAGCRRYYRKYRQVVLDAVKIALDATGHSWRYSIKFCKSSFKWCKFNIDVYAAIDGSGVQVNADPEKVKDRICDTLNEKHAIKQHYSVSVDLEVVKRRY